MTANWMLYGATGYTGSLIARTCVERGLRPTLAGRGGPALHALARELGLPVCEASLADEARLAQTLQGMAAVLHCAGPFSRTGAPMRRACLAAGTHYLDITGEIDALEETFEQGPKAQAAGVLLCPGVGFDVVPTDCVAVTLKQAMPGAVRLTLGFSGVDSLSAGTTATSMEAIYRGCARVRQQGRIVDLPFGERGRLAEFGRGPEPSFVVPWGDVATAFHSTGIGDIEVHVPRRSPGARAIRSLLPVRRWIAAAPVRGAAHALLRRLASGPSARRREQETTRVWGEVADATGRLLRADLVCANGYTVTVETALMAVRHVLEQGAPAGFRTPAQLMGARCIESIPGSGRITIGDAY